jgi:hypothetical protein
MATATPAAPRLQEVLANRRWTRRTRPFPVVIARNVLTERVYAELEKAFRELLDPPDSDSAGLPPGCTRYRADHVQWGVDFGPVVPHPFGIFFSRAWHDMLATIFSVPATGHMSGGLHHHDPGSAPGRVHHDLNPGWFDGHPPPEEITLTSCAIDYKTGEVRSDGVQPVETIRAVTMIFFLDNGGWRPAVGGGTGLYARSSDRIDCPAVAIPPIDNSLVAFECTPFSFHGFLGSPLLPRNSLILWLHRPKAEALARWGASPVVPWRV